MSTRKTAAERIETYRTMAAQIEEKERRKLLGKSPQWMATKRAIANLELALACMPDTDEKLGDIAEAARNELLGHMIVTIGTAAESVA